MMVGRFSECTQYVVVPEHQKSLPSWGGQHACRLRTLPYPACCPRPHKWPPIIGSSISTRLTRARFALGVTSVCAFLHGRIPCSPMVCGPRPGCQPFLLLSQGVCARGKPRSRPIDAGQAARISRFSPGASRSATHVPCSSYHTRQGLTDNVHTTRAALAGWVTGPGMRRSRCLQKRTGTNFPDYGQDRGNSS
jgi:hypothetical protein